MAQLYTIFNVDGRKVAFLDLTIAAHLIVKFGALDFSEDSYKTWKQGDSINHFDGVEYKPIMHEDAKLGMLLRIAHYGGGQFESLTMKELQRTDITYILRKYHFAITTPTLHREQLCFTDEEIRIAYMLCGYLANSDFADECDVICAELTDDMIAELKKYVIIVE